MADEEKQQVPLKDYLEQQVADVRRATDIALTSNTGEAVPLRQHIERIFEEHRAAMDVAEREREKAAQIAREGLAEQFRAGDIALERHIKEQVQQIRQLVELQRQMVEASALASEKAISKAEVAADKRFEAGNAFRTQLAEQASTFATREGVEAAVKSLTVLIERNREDIAEQRGTYLPLTTHEGIVAEWSVWRSKVEQRLTEGAGLAVHRRTIDDLLKPMNEAIDSLQSWQFKIAGALILVTVVLPGIVAFAVYLLTRTSIPAGTTP